MPLTRYQIRNEFSLADPELYRFADKNDPEELLEGVAMAGLVGVLRQLGDLAEFAAEIFHDLHEEVTATASRGYGLMARIQQLEADVPSIENSFLSRTNHTAFYYNTGVDWHPQMSSDENLITQGDMPRFIRDYYEDSCGPPQLFLLDKFDIGGAGACLKRYTDPAFFKAESTASESAKLEIQRDGRARKIKEKGSRWRNGDTPEVLTTSRAKLHQLLLEDRIENVSGGPTLHVKLKKKILDDSKSRTSYMENFLQTVSPEHPERHGTEAGQPTLRLRYNHISDSEHRVFDVQAMSAAEDSVYFSPRVLESKPRPSFKHFFDLSNRERNKGYMSNVDCGNTIGNAYPIRIRATGTRGENGVIYSSSDDIANESENYMDAYADVESEVETYSMYRPHKDDEYKPTKELRSLSTLWQGGMYDSNVHVHMGRDRFLDSHSVDNSETSYDGSLSFMKETSSSSVHDVPPYDENWTAMKHAERDAGSFPSAKTYGDVAVDDCSYYPDNVEIQNTTSGQYLAASDGIVDQQDVSFQQSDQGLTPLDHSHCHFVSNQAASDRLHLDSAFNSTSLSATDHNLKPSSPLTDSKINLEVAPPLPPLPPMQWTVGNPIDSFLDTERESDECIMESNGSSQPFSFGEKGSFTFTAVGGDVKQPQEAQTLESSSHTSIDYPGPSPTHSLPQMKDTIDEHGQHSIPHGRTFPDSAQPDTHAFAKETQKPSSSYKTDGDAIPTTATQPDHTVRFPVLMPGDTTIHTIEAIQPKTSGVTVLSARETTQPSAALQLLEPPIGDTFVSESMSPVVSMPSTDQSVEKSNIRRKTEHAAQCAEETNIKSPVVLGSQVMNEENHKQDVKCLGQEETQSSNLPNYEDEKLVEKKAPKLPPMPPQKPLVESVDLLDRSKLKKVPSRNSPDMPNVESVDTLDRSKVKKQTPRNRPGTPNVDERDSLLELIRSKSFNLKPPPPPAAKTFVRTPTMNLKVSAILEKANRIRQATAGSDEEDDWE